MNRRNIVQFKPEGVANIFAPTIRIHGAKGAKNNVFKEPANNNKNSYVNYPQQQTVSIQRQQMAQENARQNNFDEVYNKLFGNLMSNEYVDDISNNLLSDVGAPIPSGVSRNNYEILASHKLRELAECIEKGGNCVHRDKCEPHNKIGNCFSEEYTCCKETSPEEEVSPGRDASAAHGGWGDNMNNNAGSETGDVGYLTWQTSTGVNNQENNNYDNRFTRSQNNIDRKIRQYEAETERLSGMPQSIYQNVTTVDEEMDPYFCSTFCAGSYNLNTGEYQPRPCEGDCAKCDVCINPPNNAPNNS